MKKKVLVIGAILGILAIVVFSLLSSNNNKNTVTNISQTELDSETRKAMTYNEITDEDADIDNCENVKFTAFFTRDLDGDGYAEKYDGTCNHINKKATLYFDINVTKNGTLKNGRIQVNGKNFNMETALVKDVVIKNDYIGNNISTIELNDIDYGTEKLFSALIYADIGNNINNYSAQNNVVNLTGTWVSTEDPNHTVEINKVINLQTDWYGETSTVAMSDSRIGTTHDISGVVGTNDISLSFNVGYIETEELLLLQKQVTEVTIPYLNGYSASSVTVSSSNCTYEYDEASGLLVITREATVDENGNVTKSISRNNTYTVNVKYPIAAYEAITDEVIRIAVPTKGYYYGFNNPSEEFENPYISSASRSYTHVWRASIGTVVRFNIDVGTYAFDSDTNSYKYIISKELPLRIYNGMEIEEGSSDEYIVRWRVSTGSGFANQTIHMGETINKNDEFLNSEATYLDMYDYIKTKGIYFENADSMLGYSGWIKIYDGETDELLETFDRNNWNKYNATNPYYFDRVVKEIRVETSSGTKNSNLYVYQVKEIDDIKLTESFTYEEFKNLNYIYSYLTGYLADENMTKMLEGTDAGYAYYQEPVSTAKFSIYPSAITNQETKTVEMTIETTATYYNERKWKNGEFVIELPEEILDVVINGVRISNSSVRVVSYETYEENGRNYIKIYTANNEEALYTLTISTSLTADPRKPTVNKSVNLYAINENCPNYRTSARIEDSLDINGNANTAEYIFNKKASLQIIAPSSLITAQTLNNFDDIGTEVVSPQIAILDKSNNNRDATINLSVTNNYSGTISETIIVGKIPFEGNAYQINGKELGSTYSVSIKNTGIVLPEKIKDIATVYYSTNDVVTNDMTDEANNWKTAEEVTDWTQIKTYAIDLSSYTLERKEELQFSYQIEIPGNINYNDITFSTHGVYFSLDTEDGKLRTKTEVNRLGIMIAKKYAVEITKYKKGASKKVAGAVYKVTDGELTRTGVTNENGNISISGLYVDKEYTLSEIQSPEGYVLNENEVKFKITVDENGEPVINIISGELRENASISSVDGVFKLDLKVEDIAKYDIAIIKKDAETGENLKGVKFKLTGGIYGTTGRVFTTNANGEILMSNLTLDTEYSLEETKADGYYIKQEPMVFSISRNSENQLVITSDSEEFTNAVITETEDMDKALIDVNITNEAIPKYSLKINKTNKELEPLENTQFKLTNVETGEVTYHLTDAEGKIEIPGLYQYVEGKYITGEYIIQEVLATEGYITDTTEVKFKATLIDGVLEITILDGLGVATEQTSDATSITFNFVNKPIFNLTKLGDNNVLLPGARFVVMDLEGNAVTDVNGDEIGKLEDGASSQTLEFTSTGNYAWTKNSDGIWVSGNKDTDNTKSKMTSNDFIVTEDSTLEFDWTVSSEGDPYDYAFYTITNLLTNEKIGGESTNIGGTAYGAIYEELTYNNVRIELDPGTYKLEFTYSKDESGQSGLDAAYVKNVTLTAGYYALTTDSEGKITANLPEGLYKVVEVEAPTGYELPVNEEDRTYYIGIGASREEEAEFKVRNSTSITGMGFSNINDSKATPDGGYIVAGSFAGEYDLKGDGSIVITSVGNLDMLVVKYTADAQIDWYYTEGTTGADEITSVDILNENEYVIAGYKYGDNFEDGIIIKLNSKGTKVSEEIVLSGNLEDKINDVIVLSTGDIVVTGTYYSDALTLDTDTTINNSGKYDAFVACYSSEGECKWSQAISGTDNVRGTSLTETSSGVVASIDFLGTITIGENGETVTSAGNQDAVLVNYSKTDGTYNGWHKQIGGTNNESIINLTTDAEDNIVAVGGFASPLTIGNETISAPTTSYSNALLLKLASANGDYISNLNFGGTSGDEKLTSVVATEDGGLLIGGWFSNSKLDIDGNGANDVTVLTGLNDGILIKLNDTDELEWVRKVDGTDYDAVYSVIQLADESYIASGDFSSSGLACADEEGLLALEGYSDAYMIQLGDVVTEAEIPQVQEIEVTNELEEFEITTEIGENSDGERAGGTITGEINTLDPNIKLVEKVKYGYDSINEIEIIPSENYSIYSIEMNNQTIEFIPDDNGSVTLPIFENVQEDYHIKVIFEKDLSSVLVHHYLKNADGNYDNPVRVADDEYLTGKIGSDYTTSPKMDLERYELEKVDGVYKIPENSSGKYEENQIVVIYYYEEKQVNLTVHHYLEGTENKLADDENSTMNKGDSYETAPNEGLLETYDVLTELTIVKPETAGTSGEIQEDTIVIYYYKLKEYKITTDVKEITVNLYDKDTNEVTEVTVKGGMISGEDEEPYEIVPHGNNSTKEIKAIPDEGYKVKTITVNGEEIEFIASEDGSVVLEQFVNVIEDKEVIVEFERIQGDLIVHYYEDGTTNKLSDDVTRNGNVGDPYATKEADDISENYELVSIIGETSGEFVDGTVTVIYYYRLKDVTVTDPKVEKTATESIDERTDKITYTITYTGVIDTYIGNAIITLIDELPYEIDEEASSLAEGTYDAETKTITWEIDLGEIDTFANGPKEISETKEIEVLYKGIDVTQESMINQIKSTLKLPTNDKEYEDEAEDETLIEVKGNVIVKYIDENSGEEISDRVTKTGKVGEGFDVSEDKKTIEGYKLVKEPEEPTGTYEEEEQEKIYYYKKVARVRVEYIDKIEDTKLHEDVIIEGLEKDPYETEQKSFEGYTFIESIGETVGEMTITKNEDGTYNNEILVQYYYVYSIAGVREKHISEVTGETLYEKFYQGNEGDEYSFTEKEFEGYELNEERYPENAEGTMTKEEIIVEFYYNIKDANVENEVTKEATESIDERTDKVSYTITYTAKIDTYIGKVGLMLVDYLPYAIDEEESSLDGGVYDAEAKTITWDIDLGDIDTLATGENIAEEINIEKNIEVLYEDVDVLQDKMLNKVKSGLFLAAQNKLVEDETEDETLIEVKGKVIVKYVDKYSEEEISDRVEKEDKVGKEFDVSGDVKEIDGYTLIEEPEIKTGLYKEEVQEKIYYYAKNTDVRATYIDKATGEEIAAEEIIEGYEGKAYETEQKIIEGYTFVESTDNTEGTMERERIEVIYKYLYNTKVIVQYIDRETGETLEIETEEGLEGDEYESIAKEFENYILVEEPEEKIVIMTKEEIILKYYYEKIPAGVIEKHIDEITGEILDENLHEGKVGDSYSTTEKEFEGYELNRERYPENASGKMTEEVIEVKYYYKKKAKVRVEYIDKTTGEDLAEDIIIEGYEKDPYTTEAKEFENYELVEIPTNSKGEMTVTKNEDGTYDNEIIVQYYYVRISAGVIEKHIDIKSEKILAEDKYEGLVGDEYSTEEKDFIGYKLVEERYPENATGKMTIDVIEVKYYYIREVEVVAEYIDKYTGKKILPDEIEKGYEGDKYKTEQKEIDGYEFVEVIGTPEGIMNPDEDIKVTYYYIRPAKVIVKYIDEEKNEEIAEREHQEGYYGDKYVTTAKVIKYYKLSKLPENATGTMDGEIEVIYYYRKAKFDLSIDKTISSLSINGSSKRITDEDLMKAEVYRKSVNSTNIKIEYNIAVKNEGEIAGKAVILERIPEYLKMNKSENKGWTIEGNEARYETEEIAPGETKNYKVVMTWIKGNGNFGTLTNIVKIEKTENELGYEETDLTNNSDEADTIVTVSTGVEKVSGIIIVGIIYLLTAVYVNKRLDYIKVKSQNDK